MKYECLHQVSVVSVTNQNGKKYAFNNHTDFLSSRRYRVGTGNITFTNVSPYHPIAILNKGKTDLIQYTGVHFGGQKSVNEHLYKFYYGNVTMHVKGDFGVVDYYCYRHGYMGGEQGLEFSSGCPHYKTPISIESLPPLPESTPNKVEPQRNESKGKDKSSCNDGSLCGDNLASKYQEIRNSSHLTILTNAVPNHPYHVDRQKPNPNKVCEAKRRLVVPLKPLRNDKYTESLNSSLGPIGVLKTGAFLFNHLAHPDGTIANHKDTEQASFDSCHGHADSFCHYHYHELARVHACSYDCVWDECEHIGYMRDGFKIYSHCRKGTSFLKSCYVKVEGESGSHSTHYEYQPSVNCDLDEANGYDFTNRGFTDHLDNPIEGYAYVASESYPYIMPKYAGTPMPMEKYSGAIDKNYNYKCPVGSGTAISLPSAITTETTSDNSGSNVVPAPQAPAPQAPAPAPQAPAPAPQVQRIQEVGTSQGYSYY